MTRLDLLMSQTEDPIRIKAFADASHRLQEQERLMSGRPLPGSIRPATAAPAQAG